MKKEQLAKKLRQAATAAAQEAMSIERGRCLWCLDRLVEELKEILPKVVLNETQRHIQETKIKIAQGLCFKAKRMIVSGLKPGDENGKVGD